MIPGQVPHFDAPRVVEHVKELYAAFEGPKPEGFFRELRRCADDVGIPEWRPGQYEVMDEAEKTLAAIGKELKS